MSSFLSFANQIFQKVFQLEPYQIVEVKNDDYIHFDILTREESLILYCNLDRKDKPIYELVLHRENSTIKKGFSLYRSTNGDEAQIYFLRLHDKLPLLVKKFPNLLYVSTLQEICKYINENSTQNLAHICANFGYIDYFRQLSLELSSTASTLKSLSEINDLINERDKSNGKTCLQIAIEKERLNIIQSIISLPNIVINYEHLDNFGNNYLHIAAKTNEQILSILCSIIKTIDNNNELLLKIINSKNNFNYAPLYLACQSDKPACVKELLKNGADVNGASQIDDDNIDSNNNNNDMESPREENIIQSSSDLNDDRLINMLNVKYMKYGGTPLHWCKSSEVIELLVERNCNLNAKNFYGETALHHMVRQGNLNCIISLLCHDVDINNNVNSNGQTPLHLSIKSNNISIVQALIVFGANVNLLDSKGQSARHLAATLPSSSSSSVKDQILYILNSVGARRCSKKLDDCNEGCLENSDYNGQAPNNYSIERNLPLYDKILFNNIMMARQDRIISANQQMMDIDQQQQQSTSQNDNEKKEKKKIKLLCLDGGGIRGLILIQFLSFIENKIINKKIIDTFDWIAATSTGSILSLLLLSGFSPNQCRQIYFLLKDKLFINYCRPYCSDTLERFLQKYLGSNTRMMDFTKPRMLIPATIVDVFPPKAKFFRNYNININNNNNNGEQLNDDDDNNNNNEINNNNNNNNNENNNDDENNELLWKVARSSGAAPTYFQQFDHYIDGGLIANNPTMDLLHEIHYHNCSTNMNNTNEDIYNIDLVLSIGTGILPDKKMDKLYFNPLFSISGLTNFATSFPNLIKVLVEQASLSNGRVVDRSQAWCSMINVPYFRLNPSISDDIQMDECDNIKLINMLWETMAYIHCNQNDIDLLIKFLLN